MNLVFSYNRRFLDYGRRNYLKQPLEAQLHVPQIIIKKVNYDKMHRLAVIEMARILLSRYVLNSSYKIFSAKGILDYLLSKNPIAYIEQLKASIAFFTVEKEFVYTRSPFMLHAASLHFAYGTYYFTRQAYEQSLHDTLLLIEDSFEDYKSNSQTFYDTRKEFFYHSAESVSHSRNRYYGSTFFTEQPLDLLYGARTIMRHEPTFMERVMHSVGIRTRRVDLLAHVKEIRNSSVFLQNMFELCFKKYYTRLYAPIEVDYDLMPKSSSFAKGLLDKNKYQNIF